jgi:hypothetical protein
VKTVNNKLHADSPCWRATATATRLRARRENAQAKNLQKMENLAGLKSTELASAFFSCVSVLQTWYAAYLISKVDQ